MGTSLSILTALAIVAPQVVREPATVLVVVRDPHGLVRALGDVRSEIEKILLDGGVQATFVDDDGAANRVEVVLSPSDPSEAGWRLKPAAMGVYLSAPSSRTVFVFYNQVVRVLGQAEKPVGLRSPRERRDLSRALARVAVHEIVHRLAPHLSHAEAGLMQERVGPGILTRERSVLDAASIAALRGELDRPRPLVAGDPNE